MNGLELSRNFYLTYGAPMLHEQFPEWEHEIAVGLVGSGSECFGYDDDVSRDHDFEPGFCLFVPDEDVMDRRTCFLLERAYSKLPKEFGGVRRSLVQPVGGSRHGVIRIGDFYESKTGSRTGELSLWDWFSVPEFSLAEATNGEVFRDDRGEFSAIRQALAEPPEDVRRKKLAAHLLLMAQAGQYNFLRCLAHGEPAAAQLAVVEFVKSTMQTVFLLNRRYLPFYKWQFRALRELPILSSLADTLEFLLTTENSGSTADTKGAVIEDVAAMIIAELQAQSLTSATCGDLEKHAYSVNDGVQNADLRNRHILFAV